MATQREKRYNSIQQIRSSQSTTNLLITKFTIEDFCKQLIEDSVDEEYSRLTRRKVNEKEDQIKSISEREFRMMKRNNEISITSLLNNRTSIVEEESKNHDEEDQ